MIEEKRSSVDTNKIESSAEQDTAFQKMMSGIVAAAPAAQDADDVHDDTSHVLISNNGKDFFDGKSSIRNAAFQRMMHEMGHGDDDSADLTQEEKEDQKHNRLGMFTASLWKSDLQENIRLMLEATAPDADSLFSRDSWVYKSIDSFDKGIDNLSGIARVARGHGTSNDTARLDFSGYNANNLHGSGDWSRIARNASVKIDKNLVLDGSFEQSFQVVLASEGGFANHKADRGGATIYGIASKANPKEYAAIMACLKQGDKEGAMQITMDTYKTKYWDRVKGIEGLSNEAKLVAFDAAINHGVGYANKMVARVGDNSESMLAYRSNTYKRIIENDHSQSVFAKGWANRLAKLDAISDNQPPTSSTLVASAKDDILREKPTVVASAQPQAKPQQAVDLKTPALEINT